MQVQNTVVSTKDQAAASLNKEVKTGKSVQAEQNKNGPEKAASLTDQKAEEQTSAYLKVLSRLENLINKDELPEKALEGFTKALAVRLEEAKEDDRKLIAGLPEAKAFEIKTANEIPGKIQESLEDKDTAAKAFALLKNPKFVELMEKKEDQSSSTYGPDGKTQGTVTKDNKADSSKGMATNQKAETAVNNKQALAAIKAAQNSSSSAPGSAKKAIAAA
ncbi:MAG: hypothetical protein HQM14_11805 [SAR324 cluster bacterium]|nr:hypothetical protein [SAR324 cluster bacterium]